jgi:hypothetical protein
MHAKSWAETQADIAMLQDSWMIVEACAPLATQTFPSLASNLPSETTEEDVEIQQRFNDVAEYEMRFLMPGSEESVDIISTQRVL